MMREIVTFLQEHPDFGTPVSARNLTKWAKGKLQRIDFSTGKSLAFYELNGRIITVWDRSPGAEDAPVWGKPYEPEPFVPVEREGIDGLPAYKLIDVIELAAGGRHGEAIVPSLSAATTLPTERESIARAIASREGIDSFDLYSTEEARMANQSASYSERHPGAIDKGYLGRLEGGRFTLPIGTDEAAIKAARRDQEFPAVADVRRAVEKARSAAQEYKSDAAKAAIRWRILDRELGPIIQRHKLGTKDVDELLSEYPDFRERPDNH